MTGKRTFLTCLALVAALALPAAAFADATFVLVPVDDPGEGFLDATPRDPVPGNPGATLGEQRLNAFQAAADAWGQILDSEVPIFIEIDMDPLPCDATSAVLGGAGPFFVFADFPGEIRPETWHVGALANSLVGLDLLEGDSSMGAIFNSDINQDPACLAGFDWWYGIGAPAPANTVDFFTVVLHELAHGLGFTTVYDRQTGELLSDLPDTYLINLEDHSLGFTWPSLSAAERLASSTDTGDLHWVGPNVLNASGVLLEGTHPTGHVRMYAPSPFELGSSVTHFDTSLVPNELMEPFLNADATNVLTTELLRDIGWRAATGATAPCVPGPFTLCIDDIPGDRRFQVQVQFETVQGGGAFGMAHAVPLAPLGVNQGGLFWFFQQENPELLLKVLNGCSVNGFYWVFFSAVTNVEVDVLVTDTQTGDTFLSVNPDVTPAPVLNASAFACDGMGNGTEE